MNKLPNPPVSRMLAGRIVRAHNARMIVISRQDVEACKEAITGAFVGDQLRRRLVKIWLVVGPDCLKYEVTVNYQRRPEYDELDELLND
jgi:hypothetical protein